MKEHLAWFFGLRGEDVHWPKLIGGCVVTLGFLNLVAETVFAILHTLGYVDHHLWGLQEAAVGSAIVMGVGALMYSGELKAVVKARFGEEDEEE